MPFQTRLIPKYQTTSLEVPLPIATSVPGVHFCEHPKLTTLRPQRFTRSRRLPPPRTLRAYFIPLPRPGFTFQGFSSLPSRPASSACRSLLPLAPLVYR
jgi:hypothetical protein